MKQCGADTTNGDPCTRPAGWGTDHDLGPCKDHLDDRPETWEEQLKRQVPEGLGMMYGEAVRWLKRKGVWTWGNGLLLVAGLNRWRRYLESDRTVTEEGLTQYDAKNERTAKNPAWTVNKQAINQLRLILNSLGVTTSSMSQISFEGEDDDGEASEMEKILQDA